MPFMHQFYQRIFALLTVILCLSASLRLETNAQIKPVYDQGALGLGRLLKRLNTTASAMMIGAHPDDEDTALLAYLARGENARTAYLSLTRGDGGQNIIGPELGEALGVIRTEELLQARKLDGAEQYFTRAYDYGFSKTLAEAREKWDEKVVLCDAVRAIRSFRPMVVIAQFTGTPADGHGQHQYSGYLAPIAVIAAADSSQCTDAGPVWQVKKFYIRHRGADEPTLRIDTGRYDPMLGRSYFEIAMEARSQHRTQEQGVLELKGAFFSSLDLDGAGKASPESSIFASLDSSIRGVEIAGGEGSARFNELAEKLEKAASLAQQQYDIREPAKILPILIEGFYAASEAIANTQSLGTKAVIEQKQGEFLSAIKQAAGIQLDVLSDTETVVPGAKLTVASRVFYPAGSPVSVKSVRIMTPKGWSVTNAETAPQSQGQQFRRESPNFAANFNLSVAADAVPTQPYWLARPRQGDLFSWSNGSGQTLPFQPPVATAEIEITVGGKEILFSQPVEYRYADDIRGELRRPLVVVPALSVSLDQSLLIVSRGPRQTQKNIAVTVANNSAAPVSGKIELALPNGWAASGDPAFRLDRKGESATISFDLKIPANPSAGTFRINASAKASDSAYGQTMRTIAYPHIQTHRMYNNADAKANVIDLKTTIARVGYIEGSGDRVPDALKQMGYSVETIDEKTLASGDLSRFDVIVVGIRAYQVRQDIVANNKRLIDFANAGGTLIVQYQLPGYTQQNLAPFPAQQGPRVSDENAAVTIVDPKHPIFNFPNKITAADFNGWVQERNLYNFSAMDTKYTGLLESHDAGEAENKGGLVIAKVGKGNYVYCSYSMFRQLPAGVPGAYRLIANLLSLSKNRNRPR